MKPLLGKLESVPLRDIWQTEGGDFTPWLAKEENLKLLGEAIVMELELEATEKNVGPFRADILCKNTDDDSWVLIENQIEKTDHIHLGQVLTYAAGLDAVTMVWIASRFTDEHRAALDWLNRITDENFKFFGLEVEAWKIGDSLPAPKFNIISQPNNWSKSISREARKISERAPSETETTYGRYWQQLAKYLEDAGTRLRINNPQPYGYHNLRIAPRGITITITISKNNQQNIVEIYLSNPSYKTAFFNLLLEDKEAIESELGFVLDWRELPQKKSARIMFIKSNIDPTDEKNWAKQNIWFKDMIEKFDRVFTHRANALDPSDWNPESDTE